MSFKRKLESENTTTGSLKTENNGSSSSIPAVVNKDLLDSGDENEVFEIKYARDSRDILDHGTDFGRIDLKIDHSARPLWVCPNGQIYLDTSNRYYQLATDF
eukprot:CAMPEP_0204838212 /NCGR_PEP_ID=MMETSP1346-20131115/30188_1 /ASSEMBLY_ACC=CAM_ASM_000771 /TAXON_ID=215587 /ORGANISM="Aplanochytrium stocchinoi, Strain GSBS06" /LENGTH=101 /DNA_ID=CAMNT_0051974103 /DNA_START=35 /DNA_END=337 /DNA_ORIENTATION=-